MGVIAKRKLVAGYTNQGMSTIVLNTVSNHGDDGIFLYEVMGDLDDISDGATYGKILLTDISAGHVLLASCSGDLDDISDGTTYGRILSTSLSSGLALLSQAAGDLDDIANGSTYGKVAVTDISAGHIVLATCTGDLDDIANGTNYGKVAITDISSGHILLSTCTGDLDDISDGSSYGKIYLTDIDSGHLKLTTNTTASGKWYSYSGVSIDSTTGINIWGTNNALTTRATEAGTIQCSVNSSGQILAGAGAVILDSSGITIKDADTTHQWIVFQNGSGTPLGWMFLASTEYMYIRSSKELIIQGQDALSTSISIEASGGFTTWSGGSTQIDADTSILLRADTTITLDAATNITIDAEGDVTINAGSDAGDDIILSAPTSDITLTSGDDIILTSGDDIILNPTGEVALNGNLNNSGKIYTPSTELTLNDVGAVTVTQNFHTLDAYEDTAPDYLVQINGGVDGMIVTFACNSNTRDIIIEHGTGNIYLAGAVDFTLSNKKDKIVLIYDGNDGTWNEISRSNNG